MNLLLTFIVLNIFNVIIQTAKSIITIKGTKIQAATVNALAFGLYTVVVVYMVSDLSLMTKVVVTAVCNLVGVYIVKTIEEKKRKDRLWKIEFTANIEELNLIKASLVEIPNNYIEAGKYVIFNCYCATQEETAKVKTAMRWSNAKYFITESKGVL